MIFNTICNSNQMYSTSDLSNANNFSEKQNLLES